MTEGGVVSLCLTFSWKRLFGQGRNEVIILRELICSEKKEIQFAMYEENMHDWDKRDNMGWKLVIW